MGITETSVLMNYYKEKLNESFAYFVSEVLSDISENGIKKEQQIYITFFTNVEGVQMSEWIKEKYPQSITIVLENEFENLIATDRAMKVDLFFNSQKETITVPYKAMQYFADHSASLELPLLSPYDKNLYKNIDLSNIS